jgi:hypothetical protein
VGAANTLVSTVLFYLLAIVLPTMLAFTLVVAAGLTFVAVVTPGYVFGATPTRSRRLLLALWYFMTYLVGLCMISLLEGAVDAPRIVVVVGTVAVTAPLNFIGGLLLVGRRR